MAPLLQPLEFEGGQESEDGELPPAPPEPSQPLLGQLEAEQQLEAAAQAAVVFAGTEAAATTAVVAVEEQQLLQHHATAELLPGHSGASSQTLETAACVKAQRNYQVPQQQYPQQQTAAQPGFSSPFNLRQPQLATAGSNGAGQPQDLDALQQEPEQQPLARGMSLQPSWQASLASRASLDYGEL